MKFNFTLRLEQPRDFEAISNVTRLAFANHPFSQHYEEFMILALRREGALTLSLVAEVDSKIVGHVAFSPLSISDGSSAWFALGPVSVHPEYQRTGVGSALIREGLARLKANGMQGCALVGDPQYYTRFGFKKVEGLTCPGIPPEYFVALRSQGKMPQGIVTFHEGFQAKQ